MTNFAPPIYTVGHSTHSIEDFVGLLTLHGITALADVRSAPFSRFNSQFNRRELESELKSRGIKYVFLGKELGARSEDKACYKNGRVQYRLLAQTDQFKAGLERLRDGSKAHRIAMMCAEKEPLECHRTLLVARELESGGTTVMHIHSDGHLEPHVNAVHRLMTLTGIPAEDLFRSRQELIEEAYARQESKVAFEDGQGAAHASGRS